MRSLLLPLFTLLTACRPQVQISYMYPAEFTLPADVQTVAVVDRVQRGRSAEAVAGLEDALIGSPRLSVASPSAVAAARGKIKAPLGERLGREDAETVCKDAAASGVVTLSGYNHTGDWVYEETTEEITEKVSEKPANCPDCPPAEKEVTRTVPVIIARYHAETATTWDVANCVGLPLTGKSLVTAAGLEGKGDRQGDAREDAGDPAALEAEMARSAGAGFSTHISPRQVSEWRKYFKGGSPAIKAGAKLAKAGSWAEAEKAWKQGQNKQDSDKARGKANFNLAVAAEKQDRLDDALEHARRANRLLGGKKGSAEYVDVLMRRKGLESKVQEQIPTAPPVDAPAVPAGG